MKLHLITNLFAPDSLGGAVLYTDLVRSLKKAGHEVRVTTTFSYYPRLSYLPEDRGVAVREEVFEGVPLRRVAMVLPEKSGGWRRLIPELTFWRALRKHGRFPGWVPDVVIAPSPMLAQPLAGRGLYGAKMPLVVVVQDLMADAAQRLGIIRGPGFGRMLAAVERRGLRGATQLVTISEGMGQRLREIVGEDRPIAVIPNWIHASLQAEADALAGRAGGRDARRLFYSGNLGVKQGLPDFVPDFLAEAGEWLLDVRGEGAGAVELRKVVGAASTTVVVGDLLPEADYVGVLAKTTACLITQRAGSGASFLPSKLLPALATGTPVLAVCDADSPLGREVAENGFGVVVPPGDRAALGAVLQRWKEEPAELGRLSAAARRRAGHFASERILGEYERLLTEAVARK